MAGGGEGETGGSGGGFAFTLSLKGKVGQKAAVQVTKETVRKDFVSGISGSTINSLNPKEAAGPRVIPKLENTFKVGFAKTTAKAQRAREQRFLPTADDSIASSTADRFELATDTAEVQASHIQYGLSKLAPKVNEGAAAGEEQGSSALSQLMSRQDQETQQMKEDLEKLPEQASMDAYESMPIEEFGMAMLRGMGWKEGMNVGRNQGKEIKAVEYVARPGRLGLGAQPAAPTAKPEKKYIKPGESRDAKPDLVLARDADGRQRNVRSLDEKLVQRELQGVHEGKVMWIKGGEHRGLMCTVLAVENATGTATVRLQPSDETATVNFEDVAERWERSEWHEKADLRRVGRARDGEEGKERHRKEKHKQKYGDCDREGRGDRDREYLHERSSKRPRCSAAPDEHREAKQAPPWLTTDIRVRIIDKGLSGGRLYLKKGTVVDVHGPRLCDVRVDERGEMVQGVSELQLETLVPKGEGTRVMVLSGPLKWQKGKLLQRNANTSIAAVQLTADFSIVKLPLDDISEYVGPIEEDE